MKTALLVGVTTPISLAPDTALLQFAEMRSTKAWDPVLTAPVLLCEAR